MKALHAYEWPQTKKKEKSANITNKIKKPRINWGKDLHGAERATQYCSRVKVKWAKLSMDIAGYYFIKLDCQSFHILRYKNLGQSKAVAYRQTDIPVPNNFIDFIPSKFCTFELKDIQYLVHLLHNFEFKR